MKVPSPDAAQMIRGQVPGLAVITPDANPLSSSQLSLRGITTLGQNTTPLILIDGIPGALNSVSPDEIAQIDVLKDGSAAAIYGTRGTNGVILITTKHVNGGNANNSRCECLYFYSTDREKVANDDSRSIS